MFPQTGGLRRPICTYAMCKTAGDRKDERRNWWLIHSFCSKPGPTMEKESDESYCVEVSYFFHATLNTLVQVHLNNNKHTVIKIPEPNSI